MPISHDNQNSIRASLGRIKRKLKRKLSFLVSSFRLSQFDNKSIPDDQKELRLFAMARNEALRLPYFIEYYFSKGVDRIFLIDNGSTDNTRQIALSYDNVHVLKTTESFVNYSNWMEIALDRYGVGRWCLSADIDEIFQYPYSEQLTLKQLCVFLDEQGDTAMQSLLLDMYSDKPIRLNTYQAGQNPLEVSPYFDPQYEESIKVWVNQRTQEQFNCARFTGGMRLRLFGAKVSMSKIPLFKYDKGVFAGRGMHGMDGVKFSKVRGAVLHFKYLQDFNKRVVNEADRGEHEGGAADYKLYAKKVEENSDLNCFFEGSVKFVDGEQLVKIGIMKSNNEIKEFARTQY